MKRHAQIGSDLLQNIPYLAGSIAIIRHHHERWDGHGYPDGLKGDEIPLGARIVSVADAYDAMTTARVYHVEATPEQAIQEIRMCSGNRYDPVVVDAFMKVVNRKED
jgi:HD-GYP domain-containing protein (c-di-GMP phosphodiesterase class II)